MSFFERNGLRFTHDREGVAVETPYEIQIDIAYEDLAIDEDDAPAVVGKRLSKLTKSVIVDEEGIFDFAVTRDGALVAALVLACEDDALELAGERTAAITDEELAEAIYLALQK